MELPRIFLEEIAFNTRADIKGHMLFVMDKSTHEEHLYQLQQTNDKQFLKAIAFPIAKSYKDKDGFIQISIPPGAYELQSLNNENKTIIIKAGHFTEVG